MTIVPSVTSTTATTLYVEFIADSGAVDEFGEVALVALRQPDEQRTGGDQQRVDDHAEDEPDDRDAEHMDRPGVRGHREEQRQPAEQTDEDRADPQGERELRPHQRADQQLSDAGLLVDVA